MANMIKFKSRRYFGFAHPFLTWEHHCYGYKTGGNTSTRVHDGYETSASWTDDTHIRVQTREKSHIVKTAYFRRHEEYPKHPLFVLLELLMTLVSTIRVFFAKYLILAWFIISMALEDAIDFANMLGSWALALYVASTILAVLGLVTRAAFGLDKRIDDICEENGWQKWSDYEDE